MLARPSRIADWKYGATMTRLSRVAASWLRAAGVAGSARLLGCGSCTIFVLMSLYCVAPSLLNWSWISTVLVT